MGNESLKEIVEECQKIVDYTTDRIKVAEEEIAGAKRRYPQKAKELHDSFKILIPPPFFSKLDIQVYRAHVKELLQRIARKKDISLATRAELCAYLSDLSLRVPIHGDLYCLYSQCFRTVFPIKYWEIFRRVKPYSSYKGSMKQ